MTTADWAIIISIGSLVVAPAGFVWNVLSHFVFPKPRVRVSAGIMVLVQKTSSPAPEAFSISATNFGPGPVVLNMAVGHKSRWILRSPMEVAMLNPYNSFPPRHPNDSDGPFSGGLPAKLEVGEQFSAYFPVEPKWFLEQRLRRFGFVDSFGRHHWCDSKQIDKVRVQMETTELPPVK